MNCKYCNGQGKSILGKHGTFEIRITDGVAVLLHEENIISHYCPDESEPINFCPMCGRSLKEESQ